MSDKITFAPKELADRWGVSVQTIHRMIRRGTLITFRVGARERVSQEEVTRQERNGRLRVG